MNSVLLTIGSLLILAFSALFAAPYIVDFNDYRHVFEAQASKLMGRNVNVAGQVNLRFLPAPYVRFESVSIAGDDEVDRTPLIEADNFTIWLALPPLLRGTVEAREVEISKPRLNIQVHEDGGGNWEGIGNLSAELAYMPRDVALDAVRITDGEIIIRQNGQEPALGLAQVNGVLAANSLRGPYKFNGTFQSQDETYEIRVSTSRQDDTNPMIVKSTVSTAKGGATYKFDGRVTDLAARPRLFGALTASLRLDQVIEFTQTAEPASGKAPAQNLEVGADIEMLLHRVKLSNIRGTFESQNRPQVIEGNIQADFFDGFQLTGQLGSKWMDFDQIIGNSDKARVAPHQVARMFVRELSRFYNGVDGGAFKISIGQASIGQEFLSNLQIQLSKSADSRDRVEASAQLPGGNFAGLRGEIDVRSDAPAFQGQVSIKGENLPLLTQWIFSETNDQNRISSAFYTLGANVALSPDKVSVSDLRGEVSGSALSGSLDMEFSDVPKLTFSLDSDRVDLRNIVTGTPHVGQIADLLKIVDARSSFAAPAAKTGNAGQSGKSGTPGKIEKQEIPEGTDTASSTRSSPRQSTSDQSQGVHQAGGSDPGALTRLFRRFNGRVNVRIGQLALPEANIRDLRVKAEVDREKLQISTLDFRTDQGARLVMNGAFSELARSPTGEIDLLMEGENGNAIAQILDLLNIRQTEFLGSERLAALSPARFASSLVLGREDGSGASLRIDGEAGGSRVILSAKQEGPISEFGNRNINLKLQAANPDGARLVQQLFAEDLKSFGVKSGEGSVKLVMSGQPNESLRSQLTLETDGLSSFYEGNVRPAANVIDLEGRLDFKSRSAGLGLAAIGLDPSFTVSDKAVDLKLDVQKSGSDYTFKNIRGQWGKSEIGAEIAYAAGAKPARLQVEVQMTRANLASFTDFLQQNKSPTLLSSAQSLVNKSRSIWSDRPFSEPAFADLSGTLQLKATELGLLNGVNLQNAVLAADLTEGKVTVKQLQGRLFEGQFEASGTLKKILTGVRLDGQVKLTGAQIDRFASKANNTPLARGKVNYETTISGQGLSPRGLISVLSGDGGLQILDSEIPGLSPIALPGAINAAITKTRKNKDITVNTVTIKQDLAKRLEKRSFPVAEKQIPIKIQHGTISLSGIELAATGSTAKVSAVLELSTLDMTSEWVLGLNVPKEQTSLPPVVISFAGDMTRLGKLEPVLDTSSLDQVLTVRRMEANVAELERLQQMELKLLQKEKERRQRDARLRAERRAAEAQARRQAELLEDQLINQRDLQSITQPQLRTQPQSITRPQTEIQPEKNSVSASSWSGSQMEIKRSDLEVLNVFEGEDVPLPPRLPAKARKKEPDWNPFNNSFTIENLLNAD